LNQYHHEFLSVPPWNVVAWVWVSFTTFNLNYYNVINSPHSCIQGIQSIRATSFSFVNTFNGLCFMDLVLLLRWFDNYVKGIFQIWLSVNDVILLSITSIACSKAFVVHLFLWFIIALLFVLADLWFLFCGSGTFSLFIG
jgi:hypothetical protein